MFVIFSIVLVPSIIFVAYISYSKKGFLKKVEKYESIKVNALVNEKRIFRSNIEIKNDRNKPIITNPKPVTINIKNDRNKPIITNQKAVTINVNNDKNKNLVPNKKNVIINTKNYKNKFTK